MTLIFLALGDWLILRHLLFLSTLFVSLSGFLLASSSTMNLSFPLPDSFILFLLLCTLFCFCWYCRRLSWWCFVFHFGFLFFASPLCWLARLAWLLDFSTKRSDLAWSVAFVVFQLWVPDGDLSCLFKFPSSSLCCHPVRSFFVDLAVLFVTLDVVGRLWVTLDRASLLITLSSLSLARAHINFRLKAIAQPSRCSLLLFSPIK